MSICSIRVNILQARTIVRDDYGLIRTDGFLAMISYFEEQQNRVKGIHISNVDVLQYLVLITLFDDIRLPVYAKYDLWRHGGGVRVNAEKWQDLYSCPESSRGWSLHSNVFYIDGRCKTREKTELVNSSQGNYGIGNWRGRAADVWEYWLEVSFPDKEGQSEPLLTCGETGAAFFIFVRYLKGNQIQIGFDNWGYPLVMSERFSYVPKKCYKMRISLDDIAKFLLIEINGHVVLRHTTPLDCLDCGKITIGQNLAGGTTTGARFSGPIRMSKPY
jgi:hypothetical protein